MINVHHVRALRKQTQELVSRNVPLSALIVGVSGMTVDFPVILPVPRVYILEILAELHRFDNLGIDSSGRFAIVSRTRVSSRAR